MKAVLFGVTVAALTVVIASAQPPAITDVQVGLSNPPDWNFAIGQVVIFLTLVAKMVKDHLDDKRKADREDAKAKALAEQLEKEAERLTKERAEERAEMERQRRWDIEAAERQRRWDLEDRARARAELALKVDQQQELLVHKLDQNTALTEHAAKESQKAAEEANHVQQKFNQLASAIDSVRAQKVPEPTQTILPAIQTIVADTNTRVRRLEEEANNDG